MISNFDHAAGAPRDTANHFQVVASEGYIAILRPPGKPLTEAQAFNLGIWLVGLSGASAQDIMWALNDIAKK